MSYTGQADPETSTRRKRRISPLTVAGILMLVIGLACLGWVGYQYFGTNVVAEKAFEEQKQSVRQQWEEEKKAEKADKSDSKKKGKSGDKDKAEPEKKETPIEGEVIALIRMPALGADYEIPILSGVDLNTLARGVGHYPKTAAPGEVGNFAVAGHKITHGEPFARLNDLNRGDEVIIETRDAIYTYVLDTAPKELTVKDTETWVIDPVPGKPDEKPTQELLTLTTCQDLFHSPDRSIGFGHLVSTQEKA